MIPEREEPKGFSRFSPAFLRDGGVLRDMHGKVVSKALLRM